MRSVAVFALGVVFASALVIGIPSAFAQGKKQAPAYDVVRLAVPDSALRTTWAYDVNDHGNVVGDYRDSDGNPYGFHYQRSTGTYQSLGIGTRVMGANREDEIVGVDEIENVGLYWSLPTADPVRLPPLAQHTHSRAVTLNNSGIIIGNSYIPEDAPVTPGFRSAVAWYVNPEGVVSLPVELPYLAGDIAGAANDLTQGPLGAATVIGTSGYGEPLPVSWTVTITGDGLSVVGPVEFDGIHVLAEPWSINSFGDAVGRAAFAEGAAGLPFLRRAGQATLPLPLLANAYSGSAVGINDAGVMVGGQGVTLKGGLGGNRAVLWPSAATVVDLNSMVSLGKSESLTWSLRINSRGDILAMINGGIPCLLIAR